MRETTTLHAGCHLSRRAVIAAATACVLVVPSSSSADQNGMRAQLRSIVGDAPLREGRVAIDIPALVENGNSVPVTISVESPMTASDHVRSIHVLAPENPLPQVSRFVLGPRSGKAEVRTTIRLATTQVLHVVAQTSDGVFWLATAEVEVTTAACFDPT